MQLLKRSDDMSMKKEIERTSRGWKGMLKICIPGLDHLNVTFVWVTSHTLGTIALEKSADWTLLSWFCNGGDLQMSVFV